MNIEPQIDTQQSIKADIVQALETWFESYNNDQIDTCAACYHDDGLILVDDTPAIRGREAILAAHKQWKEAEPGVSKSFELLEWGGSGQWAFCLNSFRMHENGSDRKNGAPGGLVHNVLRRQANGGYVFYWTSIHMQQEL